MPSVLAYHRPLSLDDAGVLLSNPNHVLLAGGTMVVPWARKPSDEGVSVVDLQALGLDQVELDEDRLVLGAMVRLGTLMTDDRVPGFLADLGRRELPSTLRNAATIGGTVAAAERDSVLLAGLLVHDTSVVFHAGPTRPLAELLADRRDPGRAGQPGGIITEVSVATDGSGTIAVTGRTPADVPIVAAVARRTTSQLRLALTGVAATPLLVDPEDPTADLTPPSDFRGSSEYRLHLAATLAARAMEVLS